jgi:hypothetical protein
MKWVIVIFILTYTKLALGQINAENKNDSLRAPLVSRLFYYDSIFRTRNHHIVDFTFSLGSVGYNYFYSINSRIKVGGRIGVWYFKSGSDIPLNMKEWGIQYSLLSSSSIRVWKSVNFEVGAGLTGFLSFPYKTNTEFISRTFGEPYPTFFVGANTTLFKHVFLRTGVLFYDNFLPNKWYYRATFSLGYEF